MSLNDLILQWLGLAGQVVGAAAAISAVTPSPKTTGILKSAYDVLQVLAFNIGHAANAPSPQTQSVQQK
jgi:hypothetical protein